MSGRNYEQTSLLVATSDGSGPGTSRLISRPRDRIAVHRCGSIPRAVSRSAGCSGWPGTRRPPGPRGGSPRRRLGLPVLEVADEAVERLAGDERVVELLERLSADQAGAVRARILEDRGYPDIAARLRCFEAVVRQRVSRGLSALRLRGRGVVSELPALEGGAGRHRSPALPAPPPTSRLLPPGHGRLGARATAASGGHRARDCAERGERARGRNASHRSRARGAPTSTHRR